MLNQNFCEYLEFIICKAFKNSSDERIRSFWCDGISLLNEERIYSQKYINDNKRTNLRAYIGVDGQTEYKLILKFGKEALSRFSRNLSLKECLPKATETNWFEIDIEVNLIEIQLE